MIEFVITFIAGASYGLTTVVVGQPLDTIKTRMQGMPSSAQKSMMWVGKDVFYKEGIRGLYRGGLPLLIGGSLMRSAQFGVSGKAMDTLKHSSLPKYSILGIFDYQVILAGIAGGIGRAVVEIPTDFFKVRRQVEQNWKFKEILDGTMVTMSRNTILYASFMVYIDLSKQLCKANLVPSFLTTSDNSGLTPFAKGAICANMAWLTCWPLDVAKTQKQSGNYKTTTTTTSSTTNSSLDLLRKNLTSGSMFRGLIPGLTRSAIANGSSMVVYEAVHTFLSQKFQVDRKDMT